MALPLAGYWTVPIIASYLTEVNAANNPYQERIDHLWLNFLTHYFPLRDGFGTEREPFVFRRNRRNVNLAITNLRNSTMHKVVVVEAKGFPNEEHPRHRNSGWENQYRWGGLRGTLRGYMAGARRKYGNVQTMYRILAVGDMVRFYTMSMQNNPKNTLKPFSLAGQPGILNVHTDQNTIHAT